MGKKKLKNYAIYDVESMEFIRSMMLSESETERITIRPRWWVYLLFGIVVFGSFLGLIFMNSLSNEEHEQEIDMLNEELIMNERNNNLYCLIGEYTLLGRTNVPHDTVVYEFIKQTDVWYPDIVMAQYVIESGHGKSELAKRANNFFGMRIAKNRMTLQEIGRNDNGYGIYRNWQYSILDRILWDLHIFDEVPTRTEYLKQLGYIYAEDKDYINKINKEASRWKQRDAHLER